jgi:uncharacterized protein YgiM (DUF1202 family)
MKHPYIVLITGIFILACGALPAATMPLQAPQSAPTESITPTGQIMPPTATKTPHVMKVLGTDTTWNIRVGAGLEYPIIGIVYGGDAEVIVTVRGGWVQTERGWVCGRAFGGSEECEE